MFGLDLEIMQGSGEIGDRLLELIHNLEDESVCAELETILEDLRERDRRIDETFDDLFNEVDRLILLAEDLDKDTNCKR